MRSGLSGRYEFSTAESLIAELVQVGRSCGATLFMTLLAGFHALLRRRTEQEDVMAGIPVTGRTSPG